MPAQDDAECSVPNCFLFFAKMIGGAPPQSPSTDLTVSELVEDICRADLRRVDGVRRDPERVRRFLHSLARNVATYASLATIARDVAGPDDPPMTGHTARSYLTGLERLMVAEDQPAWASHSRSRSRIQVRPKRHFVDPSIRSRCHR